MQHTTFTSRTIIKLLTALFLVAFASGLYAQATLSVQGVLTKSDGTAVDDGTYSIKFRLYDDSTGGNQVHTETIGVETIGGVYSTVLGKNSSSPLTAPFNKIYYLSVVVGSTELLPRPQLTHAPYALSLLGQSNKFPSTGKVEADYIVVPDGEPLGVAAGKGYSFSGNGDSDGGMFSKNDNNVSLWANGVKKIEISNTANSLFGTTYANDLVVNGTTSVSGWIDAAGVVQANAFTVNSNNTSGLFSNVSDDAILKSTNANTITVGSNGTNYLTGTTVQDGFLFVNNGVEITGSLVVKNVPFGDRKEMQYDNISGLFMYDNSSRRFKENITPLAEDFKLILKAQPKTYTRPGVPGIWELGYIAEEMDSLGLKKLVTYDQDGIPDGYNYEKMILYVTEVLKMQNADIEALQQEVAALKAEKTQLQSTNAALNANLEKQQAAFSAQLTELSKRMKLIETSNGVEKGSPGKK